MKKHLISLLIFAAALYSTAPVFAAPGDKIDENNSLGFNVDEPNVPVFKVKASIRGVSNQAVTADFIVPAKNQKTAGSIVVNKNEITYISGTDADFKAYLEIRSVADPSICRAYPVQIDSGCVQEGTLVTMADGYRRAIESVHPGDRILAFDAETKKVSEATVQKVLVHDDVTYILHEIVPEKGESLLATGNHPVLTRDAGWQQVDNLKPGDVIFHVDQESSAPVEMKIASIIRDRSEKGVVYNLKTTRGNYIANDILIHNKCLKKGSLVDTPYGSRAIEALNPGDLVFGDVNGIRLPVKVTNAYAKETILAEIPGKRLNASVTATINHVLLKGTFAIKAGTTDYPDEAVSGTVYDIRTESGNYFAGEVLLQSGD